MARVTTTIMAIGVANVANLMSEATALHMGRLAIDARASIISKLFVILRFQPRQDRALIEARSHRDMDRLGAAMANLVANVNTSKQGRRRSHQSRKHTK